MKHFFKRTVLLLTFAAVFTALAGCHQPDNNSQPASDTETSPAVSSSAPVNENPLIGQWESDLTENMVYTFNADGTGQYLVMGNTMPLEYSIKDSKITINFLVEGYSPMKLEYAFDGDSLNIKDSFGNDNFYHKIG